MDARDPPFGYTFSPDFFSTEPTPFTNGGQTLLSDAQTQTLDDFFQKTNTDLFTDLPPYPANGDAKDDLNHLNWTYVPPATIHHVSTTIPDHPQPHHGYNFDHRYLPEPLPAGPLGNTHDDLQAASTLYTNAHASYAAGRSHSFHALSSAAPDPTSLSTVGIHNMPMVTTPHGLLREPLVAHLPHHAENGSLNAQMAAQFVPTQAQQHHDATLAELAPQRPHLRRSYTYGTDHSFNASGFVGSSTNAADETAAHRLLLDLHLPSFSRQPITDSDPVKVYSPGLDPTPNEDERPSDGGTTDEDGDGEDRPIKKRRQTKGSTKAGKATTSARKNSTAARSGKVRKTSVDETAGKRKRLSLAGQKALRENLSDEQKRSNHILSEQKRRNLIKRGFDDLHDLVPEIRSGGLSKSSVLTEAANFLDKLVEENERLKELLGS